MLCSQWEINDIKLLLIILLLRIQRESIKGKTNCVVFKRHHAPPHISSAIFIANWPVFDILLIVFIFHFVKWFDWICFRLMCSVFFRRYSHRQNRLDNLFFLGINTEAIEFTSKLRYQYYYLIQCCCCVCENKMQKCE